LTEAENDGLDLVVLKDRAAQNAVRWRLGFLGQIEEVGLGGQFDLLGNVPTKSVAF
jgi:hypothetical protein